MTDIQPGILKDAQEFCKLHGYLQNAWKRMTSGPDHNIKGLYGGPH